MCRPQDQGKQPWSSRMLATNAATLHKWLNPGCELIQPYPCGDHWHIGHRRTRKGDRGRDVCPEAQWPKRATTR